MHLTRRALNFGIFIGIPLIATNGLAANNEDGKFEKIAADWLENYLKSSPVTATQIGDHRFDSIIDGVKLRDFKQNLKQAKKFISRLAQIDKGALSKDAAIDFALLENSLRGQVWNIETLREFEWNPLFYQNIAGGAIYNLMAREFAPLKTRLTHAIVRMGQIPNIFLAMRANVKPAKVPPNYAATYSAQNKGLLSIIDEMILPHLGVYDELDAASKSKVIGIANSTIENFKAAVLVHQKWIDDTLIPNAKGNFRVGKEIFDAQLEFVLQSDLKRADIKAKAIEKIKHVRAKMYAIAVNALKIKDAPKSPNFDQEQTTIQTALDLAAAERPNRNNLVETSTELTEVARKFLIEKDIITLPTGPVKVILMPEFQRGYAVAYCDSPGPLDKNLATYYAVSPIPDDWDDAKANSFLKEYNLRGIQDIAVHEAMPGHYVQLFHANSCKSILRAILSSGSFIEGWAVYAEQIMVEAGFKSDDPLYELTQLKVQLRTICNALIDQAIHCENMSEAEMMKLLTQTAFQEESEARGKWRRAQLSFTQLSTYFVGFLEHLEARAAYKDKMGPAYNAKTYHDGILSFGSPPMKYARAMLLGERIL